MPSSKSIAIDIPSPGSTGSHDSIYTPSQRREDTPSTPSTSLTSPIDMPEEKSAPTITSAKLRTIKIAYRDTPLSEVLDKQPYTLVRAS